MKKIIILLTLGLSYTFSANIVHIEDELTPQIQHTKKMHKKEKNLIHQKPMKRTFHTHQSFKKMKKHQKKRAHKRRASHHKYRENREDYRTTHQRRYDYDSHRNRGYRHTRNSWYLTYKYERASFYDRHGYYYGYFNRRGYLFEGDFYRYDRDYTYRDRLRGKGLFGHRFYRPIREHYEREDYTRESHRDQHFGRFDFFFRR